MTPGREPLEALADSLARITQTSSGALAVQLREDPGAKLGPANSTGRPFRQASLAWSPAIRHE
jgi:hypothetical protein